MARTHADPENEWTFKKIPPTRVYKLKYLHKLHLYVVIQFITPSVMSLPAPAFVQPSETCLCFSSPPRHVDAYSTALVLAGG